jgi:ABC-type metal ion transport system substrate-binding protein
MDINHHWIIRSNLMRRIFGLGVAALIVLGPSIAAAQQADPAVMQRALRVLEQQRNAALNGQANAETTSLGIAEENEKLKKRVQELESKYEPKPEK